MINGVGRFIPEGMQPFVSSDNFLTKERRLISKKRKQSKTVFLDNIEEVFDVLGIDSNMTISFHHHLRNGDKVIQMVSEEIGKRDIRSLNFAPSSIFPSYTKLVDLIKNGNVNEIHTNYLNGEVARVISQGHLKGKLVMNTHGGRARAIESGDLNIDVAFIASPVVDKFGNGHGAIGKSACGTLGYSISDLQYAKKVVLVTDTLVEKLENYQLDGKFVDYVLIVDSIGDRMGIVSGTTEITKDPIGLKIAKDCADLLNYIGLIKNNFSMQTGAGKTSLAVVKYVEEIMKKNHIIGSFASGGITKAYVDMLEGGIFKQLYDVQCFDLEAVSSFAKNKNHIAMTASEYGNPFEKEPVCDKLDFVILGATEIDLDFNVNVTTDSMGNLIGGSGGHADIAYGSNVTIIISPLIKSRIPIVKEKVMTVTTPGSDVDILITERGIAINPKRTDLREKLTNSQFPIFEIAELLEISHKITGVPNKIETDEQIIGYVEYRDGTYLDCIRKVKNGY
ncbi:MAG: citrate lyase subunit alpha [Candidatus Izemoplasmatales bacterium]|nr:citrate lyase subunit alpha [Candidatus Izemoplasmatales bacterium]